MSKNTLNYIQLKKQYRENKEHFCVQLCHYLDSNSHISSVHTRSAPLLVENRVLKHRTHSGKTWKDISANKLLCVCDQVCPRNKKGPWESTSSRMDLSYCLWHRGILHWTWADWDTACCPRIEHHFLSGELGFSSPCNAAKEHCGEEANNQNSTFS